MTRPSAFITQVAAFLPNDPVDNEHMESVLGTINGKPSRARRTVLRSNGIKQRYYAIDPATGLPTHNNAQLTAEAVRKLHAGYIDTLVCGTSIPDQLLPNHAVMVHGELGIPPCEVVSTSGVCLSGTMALKYAWMSVLSGQAKHAVATGSENVSSLLRGTLFSPETDAQVAALKKKAEIAFEKDFLRWMLSDGAGAVCVEPAPAAEGISLRIDWLISRSYANEMHTCMYAGGIKQPDGTIRGWRDYAPEEWMTESVFSIKQDVKQLNEHIIHYTVEKLLTEVQEITSLTADEVDWYLPHYSSLYFRDKVAEGMRKVNFEIPFDRWFTNLSSCGNTGSASFYIMLEALMGGGHVKPGQRIVGYIPESGRFSGAFVSLTAVAAP